MPIRTIMKPTGAAASLLVWFFALCALPAIGAAQDAGPLQGPSKLDTQLRQGTTGPVRVIIRAHGDRAALGERIRQRGGYINREHGSINSLAATVDSEALAALAADDSVDGISVD